MATGDDRHTTYAGLARARFDGRNAAAAPVFDRQGSLAYDGIAHGRVSQNSGAESNVVSGLALVASERRQTQR